MSKRARTNHLERVLPKHVFPPNVCDIHKWKVIKKSIGSGAKGEVYTICCDKVGCEYVVKSQYIGSDVAKIQFEREVYLSYLLDITEEIPGIPKFIDAFTGTLTLTCEEECGHIIYEKLDDTLQNLLNSSKINDDTKTRYYNDIINTTINLSKYRLINTDPNEGNWMTKNNRLYLIDYDRIVKITDLDENSATYLNLYFLNKLEIIDLFEDKNIIDDFKEKLEEYKQKSYDFLKQDISGYVYRVIESDLLQYQTYKDIFNHLKTETPKDWQQGGRPKADRRMSRSDCNVKA